MLGLLLLLGWWVGALVGVPAGVPAEVPLAPSSGCWEERWLPF